MTTQNFYSIVEQLQLHFLTCCAFKNIYCVHRTLRMLHAERRPGGVYGKQTKKGSLVSGLVARRWQHTGGAAEAAVPRERGSEQRHLGPEDARVERRSVSALHSDTIFFPFAASHFPSVPTHWFLKE